ncbi:MAG: hypothetical protein IPO63_11200 [Bacteroidetes bacterium]|nr:hypothetical protein [Bacteroidota bacterium]
MINKIKLGFYFFTMILLTYGCGQNGKDEKRPEPIEITEEIPPLKIIRFEAELMSKDQAVDTAKIRELRLKYGDFFELWCVQLAAIVPPSKRKPLDVEIANNLNQYLKDQYIHEIFMDCQNEFGDLAWLEKELTLAFERYKIAFPGKKIPAIMTYISPFSSNIMTMDSTLGVGLHFYLGQNYKYYPSLQLPMYMMKKLEPEYIVNDMMKGWLESEFLDDSSQKNCLAQMLFQGKILYAMDVLSPETPDTIKLGYSPAQLSWANENEEQIWSFFIEQDLLYNINPKVYLKYIHDGNSTNGFPKESPARLGAFIGWQIIRSYMQEHPKTNLLQLFMEKDAQSILSKSGYKPKKSKLS